MYTYTHTHVQYRLIHTYIHTCMHAKYVPADARTQSTYINAPMHALHIVAALDPPPYPRLLAFILETPVGLSNKSASKSHKTNIICNQGSCSSTDDVIASQETAGSMRFLRYAPDHGNLA